MFIDSVRKRRSISSYLAKTVFLGKLNFLCTTVYYYLLRFSFANNEREASFMTEIQNAERVTKPNRMSILPMIVVFLDLDCETNLGLGNYKLPDSSISASSVYNSKYNTSKIRLDQKGWCPLSKTEESWVKIDLLKVGVISDRSSLQEVFCKKCFLRNFAKFTGKHLRQSLFFNTVAG